MKIVHIVPHIDKEAAGPSYTVPKLCDALSAYGNDVTLMCLKAKPNKMRFKLDLYPQWRIASRFGISSALTSSLSKKSRTVDVIHNHSLWSMVNMSAGWVGTGKSSKFVNSPHGALSSWALSHHKLRKKLFWPLQKRALFKADLLHATGDAEFKDIRSLGILTPVVVLPNGVDIPDYKDVKSNLKNRRKRLLFLGRLHPVKGIDRLIQAWHLISGYHKDWDLIIVGIGEKNYVDSLKKFISELSVERCEIIGPLYGGDKADAYFNSDLFVLPTHSENFGMAVAESLAHGCPAIVTKGAPWQGLLDHQCGWWIENDIAVLTETLNAAMSLPADELRSMGLKGREWMCIDFGWEAIAEKMNASYKWLLNGGAKPDWIRI